MLKCLQVIILIMSWNRGTGTCQHPWQSRSLECMIKREGQRQSVEELVIGDVLTLYAAGTHIWGIADTRDRWIIIKITGP